MNTHETPRQALRAGFTLNELLVVLLIIGLLTSVALPVYVNQAERARISAAEGEAREIAQAMEACGAIHGFYVPIQLLDDLPGDSSQAGGNPNQDFIEDENQNIFVISLNSSLRELATGLNQPTLGAGRLGVNQRVRRLLFEWEGPFLSPQRVYEGDGSPLPYLDHVLDPWGSPYRLFSPVGIVGDGASSLNFSSLSQQSFSNGALTTDFAPNQDTNGRQARWAIVSLGPDGDFDDNVASEEFDDVVYYFGPVVRDETNI